METTFDQYLKEKKIDAKAFEKGSKNQFSSLKIIFNQVHPNSFTAQKLFLINDIRRTYPLKDKIADIETKRVQVKPKIKISPKKK